MPVGVVEEGGGEGTAKQRKHVYVYSLKRKVHVHPSPIKQDECTRASIIPVCERCDLHKERVMGVRPANISRRYIHPYFHVIILWI